MCLLSAIGTAAVVNIRYQDTENLLSKMSLRCLHSDKKEFDFPSSTTTNSTGKTKEPTTPQVNSISNLTLFIIYCRYYLQCCKSINI